MYCNGENNHPFEAVEKDKEEVKEIEQALDENEPIEAIMKRIVDPDQESVKYERKPEPTAASQKFQQYVRQIQNNKQQSKVSQNQV